jgi:branched-chain amino acid transport system substrate-binding protein
LIPSPSRLLSARGVLTTRPSLRSTRSRPGSPTDQPHGRRNRRRLTVVLACCLATTALFAAGCSGDDDDKWKGETITLGSIFSTTGDGVAFGPQQLKAAELAVEQINADGGVNGAQLELVQRNDGSSPAVSARRMRQLIGIDDALAVLGSTFSNSSAESHPVANRLKTPVLAVSNTAPGIVGDCAYPCEYIFRASLGEAEAIPANVTSFADDNQLGSVEVFYPAGDPFATTTSRIAAVALREEGAKTVRVTRVPAGGIGKLGDQAVDTVMITASSGETAASLVGQLRKLGYEGPILGGNAFNSTLAANAVGTAGKGVQVAAAWYAGNDSEENKEFIEDYEARYGAEPDQFAAQAYTGVELLAEAAEEADLSFEDLAADRDKMVPALEAVKEETPLGEFTFTEDHDVSQPIWIVDLNGEGGYDLVKELPAPE